MRKFYKANFFFCWTCCLFADEPCIKTVQPFTRVDLNQIPFHEIIRNFQILESENIPENPLRYLYPNIPKDKAFGKYYSEKTGGKDETSWHVFQMLLASCCLNSFEEYHFVHWTWTLLCTVTSVGIKLNLFVFQMIVPTSNTSKPNWCLSQKSKYKKHCGWWFMGSCSLITVSLLNWYLQRYKN